MRRSSRAVGAVTIALALAACGSEGGGGTSGGGPTEAPSATAPAAVERYENVRYGFAFDRPEDWTLAEPAPGTAVQLYPTAGALDAFAENVNVVVEELPTDLAATEYLDIAWAQLEPQLQDVERIGGEELTVDGMPAASIEYLARFPEADTQMHLLQVAVVDGRTAFVITYTGTDEFERFRPDAEAIIGSFARM